MRIDESYILTCRDVEKLKTHISQVYPAKNLKIFAPEDFLIDDAKAVVKEAYIAESEQKVLALISRSYNIYAQNSLLKILEEPPRNITFVLCAPSKTIFLPTIRSRLPIRTLEAERSEIKSGLDFKKMGMSEMYGFLNERKYLEKGDTKQLLQSILKEAVEQGVRLCDDELDEFHKLLHLAELNSRGTNLLLCALLCIYERRYK
ncbi:MAG: DNA polymerase III subunit delta' [Campylobacteraceae bacterium]|nr:DNA polymerase III subunit delta' [Campylobacteraceae bacterium]